MVLTGETEVLGEKHYTELVVDGWVIMEHWWNDTDRGNWSTGRRTLYTYSVIGRRINECGAVVEWYWQRKKWVILQSHSLRHKCHFYCPGIDPELPQSMVDMGGPKLRYGHSMKSLSIDTLKFIAYLTLSILFLQQKDQPFNGVQ